MTAIQIQCINSQHINLFPLFSLSRRALQIENVSLGIHTAYTHCRGIRTVYTFFFRHQFTYTDPHSKHTFEKVWEAENMPAIKQRRN